MSETEIYGKRKAAKYALQQALEDIKSTDAELGTDSEEQTFLSEVKTIIEEVFPNFEDFG